jgi:hypothetical protein
MRVVIALAVLAAYLALGGCSHPYQRAYASPLPQLREVRWAKPQPAVGLRKSTKANLAKAPQPAKGGPREPTKASVVKPPQRPAGKVREQIKASPTKPPPLPVEGSQKAIETASVKSPPLPLRKPQQPAVEEEAEAKFKAAQAKAKRGGVHTLTQQDIDGLSGEQIKALRGY